MNKGVKETIDYYHMLEGVDKVIVALSGGPDSVALFHVLNALSKTYVFNLEAVHINHQLRGKESEEDQLYCKDLCETVQVPIHVYREDVKAYSEKKGLSLEEGGRAIRYRIFEALLEKGTVIALGHHKNDVAETVLFNLFRGSGIKGLCGIPPVRKGYIRPLIQSSRNEIMDYLHDHHISYRIDQSNTSLDFSRNRLRHECIPYIETHFNSNFVDVASRMSKQLLEEEKYLENVSKIAYDKCLRAYKDSVILSCSTLETYDKVIRRRIFALALKTRIIPFRDIGFTHYSQIEELLFSQSGRYIHVPGCYIRKEHDALIFENELPLEERIWVVLPKSGTTTIESMGLAVNVELVNEIQDEDSHTFYINQKTIKGSLVLRSKADGDKIYLKGLGHKKLKKWFQEQKFTKDEKAKQLMIADEDTVIWVLGYLKNDLYKAGSEDKEIIKISLMNI